MSEISIRHYHSSDLPYMVNIWQEAKRPAYTAHQIEKLLESSGGVLIAANHENEPVGTVLWSHNGYRAYVWRLVVDDKMRKQGVATRLLEAIENEVKAAGFDKIALLLLEENEIAKALYTKLGWKHAADVQYWYKNLAEDSAKC